MPATITGNTIWATGSSANLAIKVSPASTTPVVTAGGEVVAFVDGHYRSDDDGNFTFPLAPGNYLVTFGRRGPTIRVTNSESSGALDFDEIIDDSVITPTPVSPAPDPSYMEASALGDEIYISASGKAYIQHPVTEQYHRLRPQVVLDVLTWGPDSEGTDTPT